MPRSGRSALQSTVLLLVVLLVAVALIPLLGGPALLLPAAGWVALAMGGFILVQLAVFRLFGLRSRADDEPAPGEPGREDGEDGEDAGEGEEAGGDDRDWRAWRG